MTVRLELAGTDVFPHGSAGRSYLLNLPLNDLGAIDAAEVSKYPRRATFRRFWPSEADENGQVVALNGGWALCGEEASDRSILFKLGSSVLRLNDRIMISDARGHELPFRVANINSLGKQAVR